MGEITDSADSMSAQIETHNRMIMAQIDNHLRSGFDATLKKSDYYVIRSETTGVLSVLSSSTIDEEKKIVFGPKSFHQCIEYVNSAVVTLLAEKDSLSADMAQKQGGGK